MDEPKIVWTESEVRARLRNYAKDDSLYDCQAVQMSAIKYGYSTSDDGIPRKIYRLLKRIDLDKAMSEALLPEHKARPITKKQLEYCRLYHVLRLLYVFDMAMADAAIVMERPRTTIASQEKKAIALVTGWLNSESRGEVRRAACKCG